MYCALYRKYRPVDFNDFVDQESTLKVLANSIKNNRVSHAYLFFGPKGTGKTSAAKLIAKMVNCTGNNDNGPCNYCESCLEFNNKTNADIIEIDAASNNGVDEIRNIRDKINFMPSISKYRVYIIDEVHMLSTGAFNALLKTLEEPPEHIIFILATTEYNKVPQTIVSRCQSFEFKRISEENIVKRLKHISELENIAVEEEVLRLIAKYSNGALRDAIGSLDMLSLYSTNISVNDFYKFKGIVSAEEFNKLIKIVFDSNVEKLVEKVELYYSTGIDVVLLVEEMLKYIKNMIVNKAINGLYDERFYEMAEILNKLLVNIKLSDNKKILFEIALIRMCSLFSENKNANSVSNGFIDVPKTTKESSTSYISENSNVDIIKVKEVDSLENEKNNDISMASVDKKENSDKLSLINTDKKQFIDDRVNNALALADKVLLNELHEVEVDITSFLHNKEFSLVVSYLTDGKIRVAGKHNVIISLEYDSLVDNANNSLDKLETLFNLLYNKYYKLIFVSDEEWFKIKDEYINNLKKGISYTYRDEKFLSMPVDNSNDDEKVSSAVSQAYDLFDSDLIEIK